MKLWVLALTNAATSDLALLVHPLVMLIVGVIKLSNSIKYFPFHIKCFELLTTINAKTGQFVPASQYMLVVFDSLNYNFINAKPKQLPDKMLPETLISLKFAKKHIDSQEVKDRIVKEALEALTMYFAANSASICFPELTVPAGIMLRKFKKNCNNGNYRKNVQSFLELLKRNEDFIAAERAKIKDKSLKDPANLISQYTQLLKDKETPLMTAAKKIE